MLDWHFGLNHSFQMFLSLGSSTQFMIWDLLSAFENLSAKFMSSCLDEAILMNHRDIQFRISMPCRWANIP